MAEYRDPTLPSGASLDRPTMADRASAPPPPARARSGAWIWIAVAAVLALPVLFLAFGASEVTTGAPGGGDATVTEPSAPTADPAAPAPAPAPSE
jgi:hypothetical protein